MCLCDSSKAIQSIGYGPFDIMATYITVLTSVHPSDEHGISALLDDLERTITLTKDQTLVPNLMSQHDLPPH